MPKVAELNDLIIGRGKTPRKIVKVNVLIIGMLCGTRRFVAMQTQGNETQAGEMRIIDGCLADEIAAETGLSAQQVRARLSIFQNRRVLMTRHATRRKRRLFRFGIRSLLVVVVVLCLPLAYMAWRLDRASRQREAVAWIRANGGGLTYDFELDNRTPFTLPDTWWTKNDWVKRNLDKDFFATVESVGLGGEHLSDLSPLRNLPGLKQLHLSSTTGGDIVDLAAIADLTELEVVKLNSMRVNDLSPLARMTQLKRLHLWNVIILRSDSDGSAEPILTPLSNLTQLEDLVLYSWSVSDCSPLANLVSLKQLYIQASIANLDALGMLTQLDQLSLSGCRQVKDVSPLRSLPHLSALHLQNTSVVDLGPLAQPSLKELHLDNTGVTDLTGVTSLEVLYANCTPVSDLASFAGLTQLKTLHLRETNIRDLSPLRSMSFLESLNIADTKVHDLCPLRKLNQLQSLCVSRTDVADLTPIAALPRLKYLTADDTPLSDLGPLASLRSLEGLDVRNTSITDLSPILRLPNLEPARVHLHGTQFNDVSFQSLQREAQKQLVDAARAEATGEQVANAPGAELLGTWECVAATKDGEAIAKYIGYRLTFSPDALVISRTPNSATSLKYRAYTDCMPKHLDFGISLDRYFRMAVYAVDGKKLILSTYPEPRNGNERPSEIEAHGAIVQIYNSISKGKAAPCSDKINALE